MVSTGGDKISSKQYRRVEAANPYENDEMQLFQINVCPAELGWLERYYNSAHTLVMLQASEKHPIESISQFQLQSFRLSLKNSF